MAGPIARSSQLLPQFSHKHAFEYARTVSGLKLFAFGLFKKIVIADNLALVVNSVFASLREYKGLSLIIVMFLFSWQIYSDFSGYTDMARGAARMLGFELMPNFRTPYAATSIGDFWRRWHISLSSWFKDYLYIPLGGNRRGIWRTCLNTLVVFIVCGLWHGAAWTFVLWGAFHGIFIAFERLYLHFFPHKLRIPTFVSVTYAFSVVTAGWVFFRAESIGDALYIYRYSLAGIRNFFSLDYIWATVSQLFETNRLEMLIVSVCLGIVISLEIIAKKTSVSVIVHRQPRFIRWSLYSVVALAIILLRNAEITEFIYLQF